MIQTYYKKWDCIELKELGGFAAIGDVPHNWYEFEEHYKPIRKWCKENCNDRYKISIIDDGWHDQPVYIGYVFYFKDKSDAVAFKLRWS